MEKTQKINMSHHQTERYRATHGQTVGAKNFSCLFKEKSMENVSDAVLHIVHVQNSVSPYNTRMTQLNIHKLNLP